jgi:hypothetical protein
LTALLTSKILGFTVPSDPKPREAVGVVVRPTGVKVNLALAGDKAIQFG